MVGSSRDNNKKENNHSSNDLILSKSSHVILVCAPYSCSYMKKTYATDTGTAKVIYTKLAPPMLKWLTSCHLLLHAGM